MKRHLCDYHLQSALLFRNQGKDLEAEEHRQAARRLIEETGYKRRNVDRRLTNDEYRYSTGYSSF